MIRSRGGWAILTAAAVVDVWVAYSGPGSVNLLGLFEYLILLAVLAPLFLRTLHSALPSPARRPTALFAVVLFGLHPSNVDALRNFGGHLLLVGTLGVALGLALYQLKLEGWLRWSYLIPVAAGSFCHRVTLAFVPLLLVFVLLFEDHASWRAIPRICLPGVLASLPAWIANGSGTYELRGVAAAVPRGVMTFTVFFRPAFESNWGAIGNALALLLIVLIAGWAAVRTSTRPVSFGLAWFLCMLLVNPGETMPALAGLALCGAWAAAKLAEISRVPGRWVLPLGLAALLGACGSTVSQKNANPPPQSPAEASQKNPNPSPDQSGVQQHVDGLVSPALTAEQWLSLSVYSFKEGRYVESVGAAQTALKLKPDYAEAYNNIAAAYSALKLWDLAIPAAQSALRLKPDFPLAKNNLAWAQEQKQREAH